MANKKISELEALSTSETTDLVVVVDVSIGETKKQTKGDFIDGLATDENAIAYAIAL